jgi:hypothetical protein
MRTVESIPNGPFVSNSLSNLLRSSWIEPERWLPDCNQSEPPKGGIIECLEAISSIRACETELHLLGVTRLDSIAKFESHGVTSFDSTSPFRQAFMDDRDNYHTVDSTYVAIRVPQVDGNPALKRAILAGKVQQARAIRAERECLKRLRAFDEARSDVAAVLDALTDYADVIGVPSKHEEYERTLEAAPWRACICSLCREHGIQIAIFRGTERNKRRGFHNLSVLAAKMRSNDQLLTA